MMGIVETIHIHIGIIFFLLPLGMTIGGHNLVSVNVGVHLMAVLIREMG